MMQSDNTIFHKTVLIREVLTYLDPKPNKTYVDVTFGGGGHTKAILDAEPSCKVIALDWDLKAIERNAPALQEKYQGRFKIIWGNFGHLYKLLKKERIASVDGILADFGTSQFQIHEKAGFSFRNDTELDMRMSPAHQHTTAASLVNESSEKVLTEIFSEYGEEPLSRKIAQRIVAARKTNPITTTRQLAELVEALVNPLAFKAKRGIHPATKIFQALRIAVNHELENIHSFLIAGTRFLAPQGRLVCISFHSLEDRLVKRFFKQSEDSLKTVTQRPVTAQEDELAANPSSRSAKLRVAEKI